MFKARGSRMHPLTALLHHCWGYLRLQRDLAASSLLNASPWKSHRRVWVRDRTRLTAWKPKKGNFANQALKDPTVSLQTFWRWKSSRLTSCYRTPIGLQTSLLTSFHRTSLLLTSGGLPTCYATCCHRTSWLLTSAGLLLTSLLTFCHLTSGGLLPTSFHRTSVLLTSGGLLPTSFHRTSLLLTSGGLLLTSFHRTSLLLTSGGLLLTSFHRTSVPLTSGGLLLTSFHRTSLLLTSAGLLLTSFHRKSVPLTSGGLPTYCVTFCHPRFLLLTTSPQTLQWAPRVERAYCGDCSRWNFSHHAPLGATWDLSCYRAAYWASFEHEDLRLPKTAELAHTCGCARKLWTT